MKKYFITETDEELVFGDTIGLDLTKKTKHGSHTIEGAITFSELSLPLLLEIGAIEEREEEEEEVNTPEDDLLDFQDSEPCEELKQLYEAFCTLEERVTKLEDMHKDYVALTHKTLDTFKEFFIDCPGKEEKKQNAQPKKK